MQSEVEQMKRLTDNIWKYIEPKVDKKIEPYFKVIRATVTSAASSGLMGVQFPFDDFSISIPYVTSMASAKVGDSVWVAIPYSKMQNAFVFGSALFKNL